jgi:hypothetical protein
VSVKELEREANHLPPSGVEVKNAGSFAFIYLYFLMARCLSIGPASHTYPTIKYQYRNKTMKYEYEINITLK